mmetsp:Transcript_17630/g.55157  ORF Transcript_17630/g.55157 Transcript_17630/m.55157 type:complete len:296 (+) Transcript_17630:297-1184(+)
MYSRSSERLAAAIRGEGPGRAEEGDVVVLLGIVDAEADRNDVEEGGGGGRRVDGEVVADVEGPLVIPRDEVGVLDGRPVETAVRVGDKVELGPRRRDEADCHPSGRSAVRRVEDMTREEARRGVLDLIEQPHPRDLVHLREALAELARPLVLDAFRERAEDRRLRRVLHRQDERPTELSGVLIVQRSELLHLRRRQRVQARTLLFLLRLGRQRSPPRQVGMSAQKCQLLLIARRLHHRPERLAQRRQRQERRRRQSLSHPRRRLVHSAEHPLEARAIQSTQLAQRDLHPRVGSEG